jgi:hypothetical protein
MARVDETFCVGMHGQVIEFILNRHEQPKGVVVILPGLRGTAYDPQIVGLAGIFDLYTTIRLNPTYTEEFTATNYFSALDAVIYWIQTALNENQFILCGHSLGATVAIDFAWANPDKVIGLVLVAPAPTGVVVFQSLSSEQVSQGQATGYFQRESSCGAKARQESFALLKDLAQRNQLDWAHCLMTRVLLVIGLNDTFPFIWYAGELYSKLRPGSAYLIWLADAGHNLIDKDLEFVKQSADIMFD